MVSLFLSLHTDADASIKQGKPLPLRVFKELLENNPPLPLLLDEAMEQLATGTYFFGMGSCEYLTVSGFRKTNQLTVKNIRFLQKRRIKG